jgi:hypothetical protein
LLSLNVHRKSDEFFFCKTKNKKKIKNVQVVPVPLLRVADIYRAANWCVMD